MNKQDWQKGIQANPKANQAYQQLSAEQRQQLDRLGMNHPAEKGVVDPNLIAILGNGRLTAKDKQGQTTLQHLQTFDQQKEGPGLDKQQGFRELVGTIAEPGITNQKTKGTCGGTSIEYVHAKQQPADFARVMTGLYSEKGEVTLSNGEVMKRNASGLPGDDSGRTSVDRIYQSSIMDFMDGDKLTYVNATDKHVDGNGKDDHAGLYAKEVVHGLDAVTGEKMVAEGYRTGLFGINRFAMDKDLQRGLKEGQNPQVSMVWDTNPGARDSNHAVVLEKMDDKFVYVRNPWSKDEAGDIKKGPPREVVNAETGLVRIKKDDFYSRLNNVRHKEDNRNIASRWWDRAIN